jgi:hypothetical protein
MTYSGMGYIPIRHEMANLNVVRGDIQIELFVNVNYRFVLMRRLTKICSLLHIGNGYNMARPEECYGRNVPLR